MPTMKTALARATVAEPKTPKTAKATAPTPKPAKPTGQRPDGHVKVFWREPDFAIMAPAIAKLVHEGHPMNRLRAAVNAVQHLLPEARRRKLHQVNNEHWLVPRIEAELVKLREADAVAELQASLNASPQRLEAEKTAQEALEPVSLPTPATASNGHDSAPPERLPAALPHALMNLRSLLVDELASIFVEAALKAMGSGLLGQQHVELAGDADERRVVVRPADKSRPSVLVVGLRGQQHIEIEKRFLRLLDLRFVSPSESKDKLRDEADRAEMAVVMTDHLPTSQQDIVKARTRHYIPLAGGIHQLRESLQGLVHQTH